MLSRLDLRGRAERDLADLPRPTVATEPPVAAVQSILAEVRRRGDDALRELTAEFDHLDEPLGELRIRPDVAEGALAGLPAALRDALDVAREAIVAYHRGQLRPERMTNEKGLTLREIQRPVDRAGAYVPGGQAPLISTVLMTAIPASVAGVGEIVLCTPPDRQGRVAPGILAAACLAGVDEIYRVGGAQAIGAMAFGTETIRPVDVIVGPGNVYVAQAKREVAGIVGVPSSFAGPSEVVVVADETTPVEFAAIDLMVQVEHGPDSVAWLVTWSEELANRVVEMVAKLTGQAARRAVIAANLDVNSHVVLVDGPDQAMAVSNAIAPEHLELMTENPEALLPLVRNAGAVFCGPYSPASVGDYVAGPSHVLPTSGSARFAGALRVDDFLKHIHVISLDEQGLSRLAPHVVAIAEAEGLATHAESVRIRGPR